MHIFGFAPQVFPQKALVSLVLIFIRIYISPIVCFGF